jgi:tetratricopeptide (TPR) repeat protein
MIRLMLSVVFSAVLLGSAALGQALPRPQTPRTMPPDHQTFTEDGRRLMDLRRRLVELDRLLALESLGRAESVIEDLEQHSSLKGELVSRRIRLAQLRGDHQLAVDLCREAALDQPLNPALWRSLASSLLAVDKPDSARLALDMYMATSPNARSAGMVAVELIQMSGRPLATVALIDSLRSALPEARFMGRQRAVSLLAAGDQTAAADEVVEELRFNPYNLSLLRGELLEGAYRPVDHQDFLARLTQRSGEKAAQPSEVVLVANLHLEASDARAALQQVLPELKRRSSLVMVLQNAVALGQELDLIRDPDKLQAAVDYLLAVLETMTGPENPDPGLRFRAADYLAMICERGLEHGALGDDPRAAVERYSQLLAKVRQLNPSCQYLYSSQIKLASFTRDVLREPRNAAVRLERMLLDLDLPNEGVALVRLTLGECYFAAGDTSRGRTVLTGLGRDPQFREAAGHAHYHLARLDLAEGHFATARDRFAVVAMDNPAAPYANDSLDLGLAIAEEMDNPTGGPAILQLYARSVYFDLVVMPEERVRALEEFVSQAAQRLDLQEKQHLLERGRFELAMAHASAGRADQALARFTEVINEHPDGRYPGQALVQRARLLRRIGRPDEARGDLEQLLAQYPDYLFIDDVRDELRNLP